MAASPTARTAIDGKRVNRLAHRMLPRSIGAGSAGMGWRYTVYGGP
jgi:hypothetical protein